MHVDEIVAAAKDVITVQRIFGEPYERDGVTVIPAAAVSGGLGAGTGTDENGRNGEGGGYGLSGRPVGAFVIKDGDVTWKPTLDPARIVTTAAVVAVAVAYLLTRRRRPRR
jgi:uncharacterized spore protein YtfJ